MGISFGYAFSEASEISLTYQAALYGDAMSTFDMIGATTASTTQTTTDSVVYQGLSLSYVMRF